MIGGAMDLAAISATNRYAKRGQHRRAASRSAGAGCPATRYSRRVALLKRGAAGDRRLACCCWSWRGRGSARSWTACALVQPAIDLREARELRDDQPALCRDRSARTGPYVVTAAVGRQVRNRSDLMSLERPRAIMIAHSGAKSRC